MRASLLICVLSAGYSLASGATVLTEIGKTQVPADAASGRPGIWSGGAFITVQDNGGTPLISVTNRAGQPVSKLDFTIPATRFINIFSGMFARGFDGSFALAGSAYSNDDRGAVFLAWLSADGQQQTIIRSRPFIASAVTMAADGSIWAAGREVQENSVKNVDKPEYDVIRRYDRAGRLLASFIPRSSLIKKPGAVPPDMYSYLLSSRGRVGWYSQAAHVYVEFGDDGSVKQFPTTIAGTKTELTGLTGAALCDDGSVVVSAAAATTTPGVSTWRVFMLDRNGRTWTSMAADSSQYIKVYGCEGNAIAFRHLGSGDIDWFTFTSR